MTDQKALRILFNTYWSSAGWKREYLVSPKDYSYAKSAGYMFDPIHLTHDEIIDRLEISKKAASLNKISDAFLVSLSTRRLELRSALGSYAVALNFPGHKYNNNDFYCAICGAYSSKEYPNDLSIYNFERYKWGGVRHTHPEYIAFDLEQFNRLEDCSPTGLDLDIMQQIVSVIKTCEPDTRPRDLEKRLASVFKSNKAEREILIEILAYCGILQPQHYPGYFQSFVNYVHRTIPPFNKIDWTYPVCWWRGADGINQAALEFYFPQLFG